ncbi:MAG: phosphoglycerate kinase [Candidatus Paceibacterota bacterium]
MFERIDRIKDLRGKKVLVRSDFNEVIKKGKLASDFKIKKTFSTISFLREAEASVILLSHHSTKRQSLRVVADYLGEHFPITFIGDVYDVEGINAALEGGNIVLCENLRFWDGEEKNDKEFAKHLASLGDVYVNDAFGVSHREHASVVSLPREVRSCMGFLLEEEIQNLTPFLTPQKPSLMILGGAKAKNKLESVPKLLSLFDEIFIGGVLANHFFKEKGLSIGASFLDEGVQVASLLNNPHIFLPQDVVVSSKEGPQKRGVHEILEDECILDIGDETLALLKSKIERAQSVLCAGPLGTYDRQGFEKGTREVFEMVRKSDAISVAGGGDTARFIIENNLEEGFTFLSTGGGAMLAFLAHGTLPALEALKKTS